jgi:hydroxymethylglutaryl-CoA reductase
MGQNINTANAVAAIFISCRQDAASVFESGWSYLTADLDEETKVLTLSLYIPSLLVGTVGGGTHYPSQRESLELMAVIGMKRNGLWLKQSQHLPLHWMLALSVQLQMTHSQ